MSKYHAKYVHWNSVTRTVLDSNLANRLRSGKQRRLPEYVKRFDSQHEFRVYLELIRIYGENRVKKQTLINILPPGLCYPKGKGWKVDFAITDPVFDHRHHCFIEAKGVVTREFIYTLACLEAYKPQVFNNLYLVFPHRIPTNNRTINGLKKTYWNEQLLTLKDLKKWKETI